MLGNDITECQCSYPEEGYWEMGVGFVMDISGQAAQEKMLMHTARLVGRMTSVLILMDVFDVHMKKRTAILENRK